jgi:hypothetical protein
MEDIDEYEEDEETKEERKERLRDLLGTMVVAIRDIDFLMDDINDIAEHDLIDGFAEAYKLYGKFSDEMLKLIIEKEGKEFIEIGLKSL